MLACYQILNITAYVLAQAGGSKIHMAKAKNSANAHWKAKK